MELTEDEERERERKKKEEEKTKFLLNYGKTFWR